jgi:DNA-binding GntR family transcriptional regulator
VTVERLLTPLERTASLSDRVFVSLRDSIVSQELAPGQPVVIEQLASRLGVSRTPIREALSGLLQIALIEESSSGALRVAPINATYVWQVFAIRGLLESLAAEVVAPRLTEDDIAALNATAFPRMPRPNSNYAAFREPDRAFHDLIHSFVRSRCPLPYLQTLIDSVLLHHRRLAFLEARVSGAALKQSRQEHLAIFNALKQRNGPESRQLMEQHLDRIGSEIAALATESSATAAAG